MVKAWKKNLILKVRKTCLFRVQGEQTLALMNVETSQTFRVHGLGAYIFLKLDGRLNLEEVLELAYAKFRITDPTLRMAMDNFIQELFSLNLIEETSCRTAGQAGMQTLDHKPLTIDLASLTVDKSQITYAAAGSCGGSGGGSGGCAGSGSAGSGCGGSGSGCCAGSGGGSGYGGTIAPGTA